MKTNPPQSPLVRGEVESQEKSQAESPSLDKVRVGEVKSQTEAPSPDKGRAGEGFLPYNKGHTTLARKNRKNPTPAENKIWNDVLRMRQFASHKFLRQKPIGNYIVDFYCSELRLVIEIDGDGHAGNVEYDTERTHVLNALGLYVVRYTNGEVLHNIQGVYDDLNRIIGGRRPD